MVMVNPCANARQKSTPLFHRLSNHRADSFNQVTHKWVQDRYQRKLAGLDARWRILDPKLYTMHSPRIVGATTLFAAGCTEAELKAKGRWSSDIAFIYARVCPQQERNLIRAMASTDATPFLEKGDDLWNSVAHCDYADDPTSVIDYDSDLDEGDELI